MNRPSNRHVYHPQVDPECVTKLCTHAPDWPGSTWWWSTWKATASGPEIVELAAATITDSNVSEPVSCRAPAKS